MQGSRAWITFNSTEIIGRAAPAARRLPQRNRHYPIPCLDGSQLQRMHV